MEFFYKHTKKTGLFVILRRSQTIGPVILRRSQTDVRI